MWLPKKIYERVPQYWLILGLLFMSSGLYFGFNDSMTKFYFGTGVVCCLFSMAVFTARLRARSMQTSEDQNRASRDAEEIHERESGRDVHI